MEFVVQESIKSEIQKNAKNKSGALKIIKFFEICAGIAIAASICFVIINVWLPDAFTGSIRGEFRKDYFLIFMLGSIMAGMSLTAWLLLRILHKRISSMDISARVDESMEIDKDCLIYTFRIKYQSMPTERNVIVIWLKKIKNAVYDETQKKLTIEGEMFEKWYSDFSEIDHLELSKGEMRQLIVYDYFLPSLKEQLEQLNVQTEYRE